MTLSKEAWGVAALIGVMALFGARLGLGHEKEPRFTPPAGAQTVRVPHVNGGITLDGDTDDVGWQREVARTGPFDGADGLPARPHSEARFVWGDGMLYVMLYAADQDIHSRFSAPDSPIWEDDSFHLVFTTDAREVSFDLSPTGVLTDGLRTRSMTPAGSGHPFDYTWSSGAHVSHELDGTPNQPDDEDEEWVLEMAIPLESLGLAEKGERVALTMRRCDTPKGAARTCASWGSNATPKVLVLD